jgi:outer membrane protease
MKNITVITVLVIILTGTSLAGASPAMAQEARKFSFSVTPCFGMFHGQAEEIVYSAPGDSYYNNIVSQLLWDIQTIFYFGVALDFAPTDPLARNGFFSSLTLKYAIPAYSGSMEDRDWLSPLNNNLTHYTHHTNYLNEILFADIIGGYSFPFKSRFILKTQLVVSYMHFGFFGIDGYGVYPSGPVDLSGMGTVIAYSQDWLILSAGLSFGVQFSDYLYFEVGINISPLVMCVDLDSHLHPENNTQFTDYLFGGFFYEPHWTFRYTLNKWISMSLEMSYRNISGIKGAAYSRKINTNSYFVPAGEAGAGLSALDTRFIIAIRF